MFKPMLVLIAGLGLFLLFSGCSEGVNDGLVAQAASEDDASKMMEEAGFQGMRGIAEVLDLTEEQKVTIRQSMNERREELRKSFQQMCEDGNKIARKDKRKAMRTAMAAIARPHLTAEQAAILEEMQAEMESGKIPTRLLDARMDRMKDDLHLSEEQSEKIRSIVIQAHSEKQAMLDSDEHPRERRGHMREFRDATHEKISSLLTEEQRVEFDRIRKERMAEGRARSGKGGKGHGRRGRHRAERRMEKLTGELNLSTEQQDQLKAIFEEMHPPFGEGKGRGRRGENRRGEGGKSFEELNTKIRDILTPEQMEKFEKLQEERGQFRRRRAD